MPPLPTWRCWPSRTASTAVPASPGPGPWTSPAPTSGHSSTGTSGANRRRCLTSRHHATPRSRSLSPRLIRARSTPAKAGPRLEPEAEASRPASLPRASPSGSRWKSRPPGRRARPGEAEQRLDVQVLLDKVAEQVEAALAGGGEADPRGTAPERGGEEGAAQFVSLKAAVPHRAEDVPRPGAAGELLRPAADGDAAVVDLVAGRRAAEGGARRESQGLD